MSLIIFGLIKLGFSDKRCQVSSKQLHQEIFQKSDLLAKTIN
jgi:hypothetical protein